MILTIPNMIGVGTCDSDKCACYFNDALEHDIEDKVWKRRFMRTFTPTMDVETDEGVKVRLVIVKCNHDYFAMHITKLGFKIYYIEGSDANLQLVLAWLEKKFFEKRK